MRKSVQCQLRFLNHWHLNPALLLRVQLPRSNVGQVAHVSSTARVTSQKLTSRVALLRWLAGSGWGAGATTLRTATLPLVHSTAEHCVPVWCRSTHTRLIYPTINDVLRIVTGCLRPTSADNLPILAGIQPAELRRNGATLSLARRAMEPGHLLHSALTRPPSANARRLQSGHPFVPAAQQLISSDNKCYAVGGSSMECGVGGQPHKTPHFAPTSAPTLLEWPSQEQCGFDLTASAPLSDISARACTNGVCPPLRPVSVVHKNKPSAMLSSNVQSIDLLMERMT